MVSLRQVAKRDYKDDLQQGSVSAGKITVFTHLASLRTYGDVAFLTDLL